MHALVACGRKSPVHRIMLKPNQEMNEREREREREIRREKKKTE